MPRVRVTWHPRQIKDQQGVVTYNFYEKKGIDLDKHPNYKDKDKLEPFDVCYAKDLPQQPSGSLDCGLYMVTYPECLTYVEGVPSVDFKSDLLRTKYPSIIRDYGLRK
ncbi:hypothetical protein CQW23_16731 [Capsicum baccatum]|uniref:Ubiquitin-like protease family profile domain-containing protein n=1 Tax=Capsicum baccatum TaxID=33114 RepID=A0A2G2WBR5_CAPBA|nr:hypothetical protein CQW23_16731 [Capsicum baccatum]